MKTFAIIGAGGFIAPKHLHAIMTTGHKLVAAMDVCDSVGILDSYFPEADFFTEFERFERHLEKLRRQNEGIDYLVVCTPNYLHDSHIRCGIRVGADVICEKPVTIKSRNLEAILDMAKHYNRTVYTIMQMRIHLATRYMRSKIITSCGKRQEQHNVYVKYIAPRGNWYDYSWKGDVEKSGGMIYNLGIHFIDLMVQLFGKPFGEHEARRISEHFIEGDIFLERARVQWSLSTVGVKSKRMIEVDGVEYHFGNFGDLHTQCYKSILNGEDLFNADSAYHAIKIAEDLNDSLNGNS